MECGPSEDSDPPSLIRVFAVCMKKAWVLSYPLSAQRRLWSDWADAQADLSVHWAHSHFVGFVTRWLNLLVCLSNCYKVTNIFEVTYSIHKRNREPDKYRKTPKISDIQNICCNHPKSLTRWLFLRVMHPKDATGIANSLGAVWSGSALVAQTCLSENITGGLLYGALILFLISLSIHWLLNHAKGVNRFTSSGLVHPYKGCLLQFYF